MADAKDFAGWAAEHFRVIPTVMRQLDEAPEWPAGLGAPEVHANPLGTPVWTIGGATYAGPAGVPPDGRFRDWSATVVLSAVSPWRWATFHAPVFAPVDLRNT